MGKWTDVEVGHLRYILERQQGSSVWKMAQQAQKKIKNRSVNAIGHKLRELITQQNLGSDTIDIDGITFRVSVVSGYIVITLSDGSKKFLHHYVWEEHNGPILSGMHVHHINGQRTDNRIQNLMLMTSSDHLRLHSSGMPPESALLFTYLQKNNLWQDYLSWREDFIHIFEL